MTEPTATPRPDADDSPTDPDTEGNPVTPPNPVEGQDGVVDDNQSDPSLDDGTSTDWSSEGGATPEGPATDTDDA